MYDDKRWQNKRKSILRRDKYMCQECKRYGKQREGSHVHHIYPYENYPEFAYDDWNLITLCQSHHNEMHDRESHKLTNKGITLAERTRRKVNNPLIPPPQK